MDDPIEIEISDLTDEGLAHFLSTALQQPVKDVNDWSVIGPLIDRFCVEISYTPPAPNSARTILGRDDEPWTASAESSRGNLYQDGRNPQLAIAKVVVEQSLPGEMITAPYSKLRAFLKQPHLHEPS